MAFVLPLGKLTILVGAGILGSVLAKEKQMPSVSDVLSTAFKFVKPSGSSSSSSTKPKDDALLAQVNSLKQELQFLVSNRPVTIVTSGGGGGRPYGVIILVVAVGYGYIWWKGWKLPDLTFATKSSLSDACTAIAKQLEQVYSSIGATKRDLSSRIDCADCSVNDLAEENVSTRNEVSLLQGELGTFDVNIQSVREVVESLESRILNMQENEDAINYRVMRLVDVANTQGAPNTAARPALEHPPRTLSLPPPPPPPALSLEPPPLSSGSNELNSAASASGLRAAYSFLKSSWFSLSFILLFLRSFFFHFQDIEEISQAVSAVLSSPIASNGQRNGNPLEGGASRSATGGFFGRIIPSNISFISRTRSTAR